MRSLRFVSIKLSLALILGIAIAFYVPLPFYTTLAVFSLAVLALVIAYRQHKENRLPHFEISAFVALFLLGVILTKISLQRGLPGHYSRFEGDSIKTYTLKINEVLKPTPFSKRYVANITAVENTSAHGSILLTSLNDFKVDDELVAVSRLEAIRPPRNPYQFDYRGYLQKQGIYHQLNLKPGHCFKNNSPKRTLFGLAQEFRESLITTLKKHPFGNEELSVIQALLLGERSDITTETYDDYKNAGAVHILAVSGLHVGILLLIFQFLFKPIERLPNGPLLKLLLIIALLWSFAFVAGLSPSIVRAVTMFSFVAYALHLNRPKNTFNILALSLFFILLIKPLFLFQVGFQMSYAAVFAIALLYKRLQRFWYPKNYVARKGWQLLSVSMAAQLGVLPLSLFYFHQFPALFFISNLIVVPFLGIILGTGLLIVFLAAINQLPLLFVNAYDGLIWTMNLVIKWVARQEAFIFRDISFDSFQMLTGYFIIFGTIAYVMHPRYKSMVLSLISIIIFSGWTTFKIWNTATSEEIILAHQTANSIVLHRDGTTLNILSTNRGKAARIASDFAVAKNVASINDKALQNTYAIADQAFFIMDSTGILPEIKDFDYLLLTGSPKINFDRILDSIQPKKVVADGSNFKSYVSRWKASCLKRKLPFHYTGEDGAYRFQIH